MPLATLCDLPGQHYRPRITLWRLNKRPHCYPEAPAAGRPLDGLTIIGNPPAKTIPGTSFLANIMAHKQDLLHIIRADMVGIWPTFHYSIATTA